MFSFRMTHLLHLRGLFHLISIVLHPALKFLANAGQPHWLDVFPKAVRFIDYCFFMPETQDKRWILLSVYCLVALTFFLSANSLYVMIIWSRTQEKSTKWLNRSLRHIYPEKGHKTLPEAETRTEIVLDACWLSSLRIHDTFAYILMLYFTGVQFVIFIIFYKAVKLRNFSMVCLTLGCTLMLQVYMGPSELRLQTCVSSGFCQYQTPHEENYKHVSEYIKTTLAKLMM